MRRVERVRSSCRLRELLSSPAVHPGRTLLPSIRHYLEFIPRSSAAYSPRQRAKSIIAMHVSNASASNCFLAQVNLIDEFDILQIVGEGWFGKILLTEHRSTQTEMVLKALPKAYTGITDFFREFHYGLHLSAHRNIITTYDVAFETAGFYVFSQEYAPLGERIPARARERARSFFIVSVSLRRRSTLAANCLRGTAVASHLIWIYDFGSTIRAREPIRSNFSQV